MRTIKRIFYVVLILVAGWIFWSLCSHRMPWKQVPETAHQLSILTYNTHAMMLGSSVDEKYKMLEYINQQNADIVCLQEVVVYKDPEKLTLPALRDAMKQYPYTYYDFKLYNSTRQFGNVVFSRYPLTNKQTILYESKSNISSQCDVLVNDDTLRLIVNHLESFKFTGEDLKLDTLSIDEIKNSSLNKKISTSSTLRRQQAKAIRNAVRQSPHPTIVVGDFNAIPLSHVYWHIKLGMRDCFAESSFGRLGNTYKKGLLGLRIDYILCTRDLTPIKSEVDRVKYSDHFPLSATIGW